MLVSIPSLVMLSSGRGPLAAAGRSWVAARKFVLFGLLKDLGELSPPEEKNKKFKMFEEIQNQYLLTLSSSFFCEVRNVRKV